MFICHCSGEDEVFPVSELQHQSRRTTGWQSPKLCEFPQELGFRFEGEADLQHLRILCHEAKIPSRVEIFIAEATEEDRQSGVFPSYDRSVFRRLGHVNFSPNDENNFEARELKTVNIRRHALYLKLILRKNHENHINAFNQVGIVAISPHGHLLVPLRNPFPHITGNVAANNEYVVSNQEEVPLDQMTPAKDPADDVGGAGGGPIDNEGMDPVTARKVRELTLHKARAIAEEDYDLAKALKMQIELLRSVGGKIADLEEQKRQAVEAEDFDLAKVLKKQIEEIRNAGKAQQQQNLSQQYNSLPQQQQHQQPAAAPAGAQALPERRPSSTATSNGGWGTDPVGSEAPPLATKPVSFDDRPAVARAAAADDSDVPARFRDDPEGLPRSNSKIQPSRPTSTKPGALPPPKPVENYDEKPAVAGTPVDIELVLARGDSSGGILDKGAPVSSGKAPQPVATDGMPQWEKTLNQVIVKNSGDQPPADSLAAPKLNEYATYLHGFGGYATACLFSKRWQLREAAIKSIASAKGLDILAPTCPQALQLLTQYLNMKSFGLQDPISNVFFTTCDAVKSIVTEAFMPNAPPASQFSGAIGSMLPELMLKAGDNNARVRDSASALLMDIARALGAERVANAALAEPENSGKKPQNHRVHVARIHVVTLLLEEFGLNRKEIRTGLTVENMMLKLLLPSLQHSHQDVREGAMGLIVSLYSYAPTPTVDKLLGDVKPAQKALIEELLVERSKQQGGASPSPVKRQSLKHEPEMASSSFSVERGGKDVLAAAREARSGSAALSKPKGGGPAAGGAVKASAALSCQFCGRSDKRFTEQTLDKHYVKTCPMLCPCPLCGQVTEIANLQLHFVSECERKNLVRQCPMCKEAVRAEDLDAHVAAKKCIVATKTHSVCPLCHARFEGGHKGWEKHLLNAPGCKNNPRKYDGGNGEEFR